MGASQQEQGSLGLAAAIHDIRNRMFQMQGQLHRLISGRGHDTALCDELGAIERRCSELSGELNALLHRLRLSAGPLVVEYQDQLVQEFLDEALGAMPGITLPVDVIVDPPELCGCFDPGLMAPVIRDALDNAGRYGRSRCRVHARSVRQGIEFAIEDDGDGFGTAPGPQAQSGLGLLIAARVAEAHQRGEQHGCIETGASATLGGARLSVWLP